MTAPEQLRSEMISARDGTRLALHRLGEGRPVILLHGLFSSAEMNWIRFGHAARVAAAGFEVIMPDLRAHGGSEAPHDAAAYPRDVLLRDLEDLIAHLGLTDFDLGGFSLGARTSLMAVTRGIAPRRLVIAGMGLRGLEQWQRRSAFFLDAIARFDTVEHVDPTFMAVSFMKTMKVDRVAAALLLKTMDDIAADALGAVAMPTSIICGDKDLDNGSPDELAQALPDAGVTIIPGTHMSCVTRPELGEAMVSFLTG